MAGILSVNGKIPLVDGKAIKAPAPNSCNLLGYTLGAPGGKNYTGFVHSWNTSAANFAILGDLYTKKIRLTANKQLPESTTSELKQENVPGIVGHKYYFQGQIKTSKSSGGYILTAFYDAPNNSYHGTMGQLYPSIANEWVTYHRIVECKHEGNYFRILSGITNCNSGDAAEFKNLILFDLTEMFGSGSEPSDEWCFAEYGNLVVDSSYPKEASGAEKCSYNGTVLPLLPEETLAEYPYALIFKYPGGSTMLIVCKQLMYWYPTSDYPTCVKSDGKAKSYILSTDASAWEFSNEHDAIYWITPEIVWSNYDIPNGSATATEIYFKGSEYVPVEASEN